MQPLIALVIISVGLCVAFQLIRLRTAVLLIIGCPTFLMLAPMGWRFLWDLPQHVQFLIAGLLGLAALRLLLRLLIGKRAAAKVVAELTVGLVRWIARAALLPFRLAGRALRFLFRR